MTIYRDETDFTWFLRLLGAVVPGFNWRRHAYCLMPNHYHLVLKATLDDLSRGMHRLNSRTRRASTNATSGRVTSSRTDSALG